MTEEKEKKMQEKYVEYQMLGQQLEQMQKQLESMDNQVEEVNNVNVALEELSHVQAGTEILVPITNGIFMKANVQDTNELLVNVGAKTILVKDIASTRDLIKSQELELLRVKQQIAMKAQRLNEKAQKIEHELKKLVEDV